MNTRRRFLTTLLGTAALGVVDPADLLWTPGRKLISLPPTRLWLPKNSKIKAEFPNGYAGSLHTSSQFPTLGKSFSYEGTVVGPVEFLGKIRFTPEGVPIYRHEETGVEIQTPTSGGSTRRRGTSLRFSPWGFYSERHFSAL